MGLHAQVADLGVTEVPFGEAIRRIEQIRTDLGALKDDARTDPQAEAQYALMCEDLRGAYASLAAVAARKAADWRPYDQFLQ